MERCEYACPTEVGEKDLITIIRRETTGSRILIKMCRKCADAMEEHFDDANPERPDYPGSLSSRP